MAKPTRVRGVSRRTPLATAAPLIVRARLADLRRHEATLARNGAPDEDAVHDMRVAARRLRAALEALGDRRLAALEDEVKALQDALGDVRDVQVLRRWISAHGAEDGGAAELADEVGAELPDATRDLERALRAWSGAVAPTLFELSMKHARGPGRLGGRQVARAVRRRLDALARRVPAVLDDPAPRSAHRLRIAAKKLRYLAEVAEPGRPGAAKALLAVLEPLQERLGTLHDADLRTQRLEVLAGTGRVQARRAARDLLELVRRDRERQASALVEALTRWREADVVARLRRGFRKRERRIPAAPPARTADARASAGNGAASATAVARLAGRLDGWSERRPS